MDIPAIRPPLWRSCYRGEVAFGVAVHELAGVVGVDACIAEPHWKLHLLSPEELATHWITVHYSHSCHSIPTLRISASHLDSND